MNKMKRVLLITQIALSLIMVSGCMPLSLLTKGPEMTMNSGILVNVKTYKVPFRDAANVMVFSPDNRYLLATGTYAKHINIYDLQSGKIVKQFLKRDDANNWRVSPRGYFSADSRYLILRDNTATKEGYHVVDMNSLEVIKSIVPERIGGDIDFSADGKYFALGGGVVCQIIRSFMAKNRSSVFTMPRTGS